ncbi:D-alanyl-D-alanine carboxypeptidase DacB [Fervidicola ferrireducens]|uniref:serine-type D-Ala-D-Ala carboxypeptidase n=2 Tax=Fervidicola ferrireducens TaxID=520764 RepID=A0A140L416_9FIRM|nr:D-alanyl-D-alanine carboxypeptidase DacB [Fervidicola ferrireducens]
MFESSKKNALVSFLIYASFIIFNLSRAGVVQAEETSLHLNARAYLLLDATTGRVLIEKNSQLRLPMASTTKIMTAILALERGDLSSKVTVSRRAASVGGSSFHLMVGETMSLENMLYGLLLPSGNDAAIAIAEHIGGDVETFVEMMNRKAREIGAENTSFKNPHGLDEPGHYTTARDLALITRYALNIPKFREIVGTKDIVITEGKYTRHIYNTNRLLRISETIDGVKTGYTGKAGRCLVATAQKNGFRLISVVLGAQDHFSTSLKLLNYGFENYELKKLVSKDSVYAAVPVRGGIVKKAVVVAGEDIALPLRKKEKIRMNISVFPFTEAPVYKNQVLGEIQIYIDSTFICSAPLVSIYDIRKKSLFDNFYKMIKIWMLGEG